MLIYLIGFIVRATLHYTNFADPLSQYANIMTPKHSYTLLKENIFMLNNPNMHIEGDIKQEYFIYPPFIIAFFRIIEGISSYMPFIVLAFLDLLTVKAIASSVQHKKDKTKLIEALGIFNPFSIISCSLQNPYILNYCIQATWIYTIIKEKIQISSFIYGVMIYIEPRSSLLFSPMIMIHFRNNKSSSNWVKYSAIYGLTAVFTFIALVIASMAIDGSGVFISKYYIEYWDEIIYSPNLGLHWYIFIEMFQRYKDLYQYTFVVLPFFFIIPLYNLCQAFITKKKKSLQSANIYLIAVLASFSLFFQPFHTLLDLPFLVLLWAHKLQILNKVSGLFVLGSMFTYSLISVSIMWNLWMQRFSGNANFFYFQTVVYNGFFCSSLIEIIKALRVKSKVGDKEEIKHEKVE